MIFHDTTLPGVRHIELELNGDERGWLARTFCEREFAEAGLPIRYAQTSVTRTRLRGMLRGLHYQAAPHLEDKLIRCARGRVFDVVLDLRTELPSHGRWESFELDAEVPRMLFLPAGTAHGFQALTDDVEMTYQMTEPYVAELARGVRWDDPSLGIPWPLPDPIISQRDRDLPGLA
ncbi:MAG: dTDP-4-dehydrorhamnose 3,5-epimerase [bacterium]|nr:dTDP-4-dehydrorhamnose 3,5-epimerase [bacterium]